MSELTTDIVVIEEILPHPNPVVERLEIAKLEGLMLYMVVPKGRFKVGDRAVQIYVDSILPPKLEEALFPPESKIVLHKSRVKAIRIQKAISQGLLTTIDEIRPFVKNIDKLPVGADLRETLGITKYEPPVSELPKHMNATSRKIKNHYFKEFTDVSPFIKYPHVIPEGTPVVITEKIHGTSTRHGKLPTTIEPLFHKTTYKLAGKKFTVSFSVNGLKKRALKLLGKLPKFEKCVGSRRVQVHLKGNGHQGFYDTDVYTEADNKYQLSEKCDEMDQVCGEIYGPSTQQGYHYGLKNDERAFAAYDLLQDEQYVDYEVYTEFCDSRGIPRVPELYKGPFDLKIAESLLSGPSVLCPDQKVREGIVIRPLKEMHHPSVGRVLMKWLNPEFLMNKKGTDFH